MNKTQNSLEVDKIFQEIERHWTGCDWDTNFGSRQLNLNGLASKRTQLLCNATSGEESRTWAEATAWLRQLESDAVEARSFAKYAVEFCRNHKYGAALKAIETTCEIEARNHADLIWQPLRQAIEALAVQGGD